MPPPAEPPSSLPLESGLINRYRKLRRQRHGWLRFLLGKRATKAHLARELVLAIEAALLCAHRKLENSAVSQIAWKDANVLHEFFVAKLGCKACPQWETFVGDLVRELQRFLEEGHRLTIERWVLYSADAFLVIRPLSKQERLQAKELSALNT